jgi:hypothetical protein
MMNEINIDLYKLLFFILIIFLVMKGCGSEDSKDLRIRKLEKKLEKRDLHSKKAPELVVENE